MPGFEWIDNRELEAVKEIFDDGGVLFAHGWDSSRKRYHVRELEDQTSRYFGTSYSNAVSSGTAAIKVALKAMGVKKGEKVLTQAFNFIATIEAILDCGAEPIICPVDDNLHLDLQAVDKLCDQHDLKAIIIVHMLGMGGPIQDLLKLSEKRNVPVLEDNCESIGASCNGKLLGSLAPCGVLSMDHGKMITSGEGGIVLSQKESIFSYVRSFSDHGHAYDPNLPRGLDPRVMPGFNYRLTEIQAAIAKVQLTKLPEMLKSNFERYSLLSNKISTKFRERKELPGHEGSYDTYIFFVSEKQKEFILSLIAKEGFSTKNLPDAMQWHCSYFWSHALPDSEIEASVSTFEHLSKAIAIPIFGKVSLEKYEKLANTIVDNVA